jgi:hypothetical protein
MVSGPIHLDLQVDVNVHTLNKCSCAYSFFYFLRYQFQIYIPYHHPHHLMKCKTFKPVFPELYPLELKIMLYLP